MFLSINNAKDHLIILVWLKAMVRCFSISILQLYSHVTDIWSRHSATSWQTS